jgi:hypothetical protein
LKPGHDHITIRLRKILCLQWLELEGAKAITVYEQK